MNSHPALDNVKIKLRLADHSDNHGLEIEVSGTKHKDFTIGGASIALVRFLAIACKRADSMSRWAIWPGTGLCQSLAVLLAWVV